MQLTSSSGWSVVSESALYRYAGYALTLYCLCFSLSIALSQIFLVSFMLFTLGAAYKRGFRVFFVSSLHSSYMKEYYAPLFFWLFVCVLSIPVSLDPLRSFTYLLKFSVYIFLPFIICAFLYASDNKTGVFNEIRKYIYILFFGQALAAVHTIISTHVGYEIKPKIPGALTESGQIVLLLPLLVGSVYLQLRDSVIVRSRGMLVHVLLFLIPLVLFAWYRKIPLVSGFAGIAFGLLALVYFLIIMFRNMKGERAFSKEHLLIRMIPLFALLVFAAFLLNLKRGPWFAGVVEILIFGFFISRSLMSGFLVLMLLFSLTPPVYERIASFCRALFYWRRSF
jgi:hypothetical protein